MHRVTRSIFGTLLLVLIASGCSKKVYELPSQPENMPPPLKSVSFLALGDSYTIGTSVSPAERWPAQLDRELREASDFGLMPLDIVAVNGWKTFDLQEGIRNADLREEYDMVSLLIGVNNQFNSLPIEEYRVDFEDLLKQSIDFAGGDTSKVFVVSIPDYAFTSFGGGRSDISQGVDRFNAAAKEIAERYKVAFLNITPISRRGLDRPELVASDGLHPSGEQYGIWIEQLILPHVLSRL